MIDHNNKYLKVKTLLICLGFSLTLMLFPVVSAVIIVVNQLDRIQGFWLQGLFMLLSMIVPLIYLWKTKITPTSIGLTGIEKGRMQKVLYFIPLLLAKVGFLFFGVSKDIPTIVALLFFTGAIGVSEELYFRGIILYKLKKCFSIKQSILWSALLFAVVHASQAFSGASDLLVFLTMVNAMIFGIIAAEIVIITNSIIPVIIWHMLFDFVNWVSLVDGKTEFMLIVIQSIIMVLYAYYLWTKLVVRL
ncbi:CPBP family intramembrane glutamic endopeptidase [Fundicoccus culcitae]|uniref:CPBP family intramembrane metalloprotease n=1 Tax=Fundicoccus culcitae TaxID=2969821 RepID=A0ABY5P7U4_9LACT|nr:CPBP family intramembrane glutamic endopeptidase [Fundicoccus culcitae]UUX34807.1 CPBP family intramembrane metalloprotease [Fundicoccus culcitae]